VSWKEPSCWFAQSERLCRLLVVGMEISFTMALGLELGIREGSVRPIDGGDSVVGELRRVRRKLSSRS
jgi:hypothetical protein